MCMYKCANKTTVKELNPPNSFDIYDRHKSTITVLCEFQVYFMFS